MAKTVKDITREPQSRHFFVALYRGTTVAEARIIGATSDPELVALAKKVMLEHERTGKPGTVTQREVEEKRARDGNAKE